MIRLRNPIHTKYLSSLHRHPPLFLFVFSYQENSALSPTFSLFALGSSSLSNFSHRFTLSILRLVRFRRFVWPRGLAGLAFDNDWVLEGYRSIIDDSGAAFADMEVRAALDLGALVVAEKFDLAEGVGAVATPPLLVASPAHDDGSGVCLVFLNLALCERRSSTRYLGHHSYK